jgi:uncharacterized protein YqiB (DUF1249 family)
MKQSTPQRAVSPVSRYKLSLSSLHATCETNYARFLRVFPAYEQANERVIALDHAHIVLSVTERCRYTTTFKIKQLIGAAPKWAKSFELEVRAYHDARMLEVRSFQGTRHIQGRYQYPNKAMLQKDEKVQQNQFVAEWLEHVLAKGYSVSQLDITTKQSVRMGHQDG